VWAGPVGALFAIVAVVAAVLILQPENRKRETAQ
jgi:hypothetical protein